MCGEADGFYSCLPPTAAGPRHPSADHIKLLLPTDRLQSGFALISLFIRSRLSNFFLKLMHFALLVALVLGSGTVKVVFYPHRSQLHGGLLVSHFVSYRTKLSGK